MPSDEDWQIFVDNFVALKDVIASKIPFVSWFSDTLESADSYVHSEDFLHLSFDGWKFSFGSIVVNTPDVDFTAVRDAYEPYRIKIRSMLALCVYAMSAVYLVKYFIGYGQTQALGRAVEEERKK